MKLLIVDNHDSFTHNLVQLIRQSGLCSFAVMKNDEITSESASSFDKFLFSPGPGLPSDYPVLSELIHAYAHSKSILGVCLGHQAIALAYGGSIYNLTSVQHGITKDILGNGKENYLFENIPPDFKGGLYHSWAVSKDNFPSCLTATSFSGDGIIMSLSHNSFDVKGVQFHPESIMTPHGKTLLNNWLKH